MKHLTNADRAALATRLGMMKRAVLDELRESAPQAHTGVAVAGSEVHTRADDAEIEREGEMLRAEVEIDRQRLHDIEQAERQLAAGRYGLCADCGEEIERERLLAQPIALRCVACQRASEDQHR